MKKNRRETVLSWNKGKTGVYSEESLRKMSISKKGKVLSEEHKQKLSIAHCGKFRSDETKQKMKDTWNKRKGEILHV